MKLISLFDYDFASSVPARFADISIPSGIKWIVLTNVTLTTLNKKFNYPAVQQRYNKYELGNTPLYKERILDNN